MNAHTVDHLVSDYLARLERAAADLPHDRRAELLEEIRSHIDTARAAGAAADEAAVRTLLDRLGEPEEIAAAARDDTGVAGLRVGGTAGPAAGPASSRVPPPRPGIGLEVAAVILLTVGSFVPIVGWMVGVVLLWVSRRWHVREKVLGTLVVPGGPGMAFFVFGLVAWNTQRQVCMRVPAPVTQGRFVESCVGSGPALWITLPLFLAALILPFVVGGLLLSRARARATAEQAAAAGASPAGAPAAGAPAPGGGATPWRGAEIGAVVLLAMAAFFTLFGLFLFGPASLALAGACAITGVVLVWASAQWTLREKIVSTALAATPLLLFGIAAVLVLGLRVAA